MRTRVLASQSQFLTSVFLGEMTSSFEHDVRLSLRTGHARLKYLFTAPGLAGDGRPHDDAPGFLLAHVIPLKRRPPGRAALTYRGKRYNCSR